jgi:hypothetical protein
LKNRSLSLGRNRTDPKWSDLPRKRSRRNNPSKKPFLGCGQKKLMKKSEEKKIAYSGDG